VDERERWRVGQPWRPPGIERPWLAMRYVFMDYGDSREWAPMDSLGPFETQAEAERAAEEQRTHAA